MSFVIIGWIISILSQELLYIICIVYCIYDIYVFFFLSMNTLFLST